MHQYKYTARQQWHDAYTTTKWLNEKLTDCIDLILFIEFTYLSRDLCIHSDALRVFLKDQSNFNESKT